MSLAILSVRNIRNFCRCNLSIIKGTIAATCRMPQKEGFAIIGDMGWTSPESRELFNLVARHQAQERLEKRRRVSDVLQALPTTEETLAQLCSLSPEDARRAMRTHQGCQTQRNIESIETMLQVFHRSMADLKGAVDGFPFLGPPDARNEREALEAEISIRVNKELLAAFSASQALVDYSRKIKHLVSNGVFDQRRHEIFDENEHALVKDLRNILVHRQHTAANWQTVYSRGGRSTHFKIDAEDLLSEAELSAGAKKCLTTYGATVDVSELLSTYAERIDRFYGWLLPEIERNLPNSVEDFRRCQKAVKLDHGRQSYKLLLGLWQQINVDPYTHLPKHLTTEQLATALSLQHRSPAQVDYIISCVDRNGVCDGELRHLAYKLFKVDEAPSST
jgi:hypothetical protein